MSGKINPLSVDFMLICSLEVSQSLILAGLPVNESHYAILDCMSIKDIILMSKISPVTKDIVDEYLQSRWHRHLRRYVKQPHLFRVILRRTRSVISGSSALHFVLPGPKHWTPNDCDVYTPSGKGSHVIKYLCDHEGFETSSTYTTNSGRSAHYGTVKSCIASVTKLTKTGSNKRIDVIESATSSSIHPLAYFWCTLLPNYISADSICIPFPAHALHGRGCRNEEAATDELEQKYKFRGFTISSFLSNMETVVDSYPRIKNNCAANPYCPHMNRSFGDKWCLQIVFDESLAEGNAVDTLTPQWRYGGGQCGMCRASTKQEVKLIVR
ncbi:uncharacterized protein STEHIDRAFT_160753 [Stereum hirsutum FP-91666 SS1]|uniref:uncharacterized protein n=1 Tax=Stereum hirsutum (strain FP-91666) TaxID=721885 RepID=UPI0004449C22|nr:uncharacterized protein STEHIDRAFT_160753 [Stereum hirsutum FP-91666 SS1]EIM83155.1 hypothetical protein STEHIDRAFT_160753 [Stereum hirsutum FP-91666 SS1]